MGVWIEIYTHHWKKSRKGVTPCMGVWIEICGNTPSCTERRVTPCMGVWIEICVRPLPTAVGMSHPVWVCGLKRNPYARHLYFPSHTLYGCVD